MYFGREKQKYDFICKQLKNLQQEYVSESGDEGDIDILADRVVASYPM